MANIPKKEIIKHDSKVGVYIDQSTGEAFETDSLEYITEKRGHTLCRHWKGRNQNETLGIQPHRRSDHAKK